MIDRAIQSPSRDSICADFLEHTGAVLSDVRVGDLVAVAAALDAARQRGARVFAFGNGGSAATVSHLACDLARGSDRAGGRSLRVTALTDGVPALTAWANDAGYEHVFAEQLRVLLDPGDVAIAVSVSARSANVVSAVEVAHGLGAATIGLLGPDPGGLAGLLDIALHVRSTDYGAVEVAHLTVVHALTAMLRGRRLTLGVDGPGQLAPGAPANG